MRFQAKSDEELQAMLLCHPGTYPFEVLEAKERLSQKGNEMIELKLKYWDSDGRERMVFDYLLESMAYKLKHFCSSTGLLADYESGLLTDDKCKGKSGYVEIEVQEPRPKGDGTFYPPRNAVKDYVPKDAAKNVVTPEKVIDKMELNDDIPF